MILFTLGQSGPGSPPMALQVGWARLHEAGYMLHQLILVRVAFANFPMYVLCILLEGSAQPVVFEIELSKIRSKQSHSIRIVLVS
jgi:hypothetical protein